MPFVRNVDQKFLETLINENVLSHNVYQTWDKPKEEDHINNQLLTNPKSIDNVKWISYLLKTGKALRYNNPKIEPSIFDQLLHPSNHPDNRKFEKLLRLYFDTPFYPLNIFEEALWVGVFRVDTVDDKQVRAAFPQFKRIFYCALTPLEAADIVRSLVLHAKLEFKMSISAETEI